MYRNLIREAVAANGRLDLADADTAAVIEDMMRTNRTGLDYLSRAEFIREAREYADALDAATVRDYCDALGLTVPAWAV